MICLSAMGTREKKSFVVVGGESFDGMAMETGRGSFIQGGSTCSRGQDLSI